LVAGDAYRISQISGPIKLFAVEVCVNLFYKLYWLTHFRALQALKQGPEVYYLVIPI